MSNSPLVSYTKRSPNCNHPRNHAIDTVTIHHMAGDLTVEQCGESFANPARQGSSNYAIGSDGRIALYVDETDRSWASSSRENDHRAITIEVANSRKADPWPVSEAAYAALIELLVDICKRHGKRKLLWFPTLKETNAHVFAADEMRMTVHRWFAATLCPGPTLMDRMGQIAAEVTGRLQGEDKTQPWYAGDVAWVKEAAISDGSAPERSITRAEVFALLHRYDRYKSGT